MATLLDEVEVQAGALNTDFRATLYDVNEPGLRRAHAAGRAPDSQIHALGDGAPWIAEQARLQFRQGGRYSVIFFTSVIISP